MEQRRKRAFNQLLSLAIVLSLVMLFGMLCGSVWAAEPDVIDSGNCGEKVTWSLNNTGTLTISGTGQMNNYDYEEDSYPPWYDYTDSIESVLINSGVTSIGNQAFSGCSLLIAVTIPGSVTTIGDDAFSYCNLESITIPNSVTSIGERAFFDCDLLESITIPNSVTSIGSYAFSDCEGLTVVTIPDSVTHLGSYAFKNCYELKTVNYPASLNVGNAFYGTPWWEENAPKEGSCGAGLTWKLNDKKGILTISGTGSMDDYESDSTDAPWITFAENIESVVIQNGVTSIGNYAFYCCDYLENVTIPTSVTSIGDSAFSDCGSLVSVIIPTSVTSIGIYAFSNSGLTSITIPDSVTTIGYGAFESCNSLTSVTIPSDFTDLKNYFDDTPWLRAKESGTVSTIAAGNHKITVTSGKPVYFKFVPKKTGDYEIYSTASVYNNVRLFDSRWIHLTSSDGKEDRMVEYLTAGKTYYLGVFFDDDEMASAKITLILKLQPVSIKNAKVILSKTAFTYNGKVHKPTIKKIKGKALKSGTDYTVKITNKKGKTVASPKAAGTYTLNITGKGDYTGKTKATYKINKAANKLKVKAKTAKIPYKNLKKKNQTLAVSKVITLTNKGKGKKTYAKASGSKKITINKKNGKVTVKKGLKIGTYKVKVKVKAAGNANYKALTRPATFTVKVIK